MNDQRMVRAMADEHTPGPWVSVYVGDGFTDVCPAMRPGEIAISIRNDADARLIAASPDLLALARRVEEAFRFTDSPLGEAARAAIAKATGSLSNGESNE